MALKIRTKPCSATSYKISFWPKIFSKITLFISKIASSYKIGRLKNIKGLDIFTILIRKLDKARALGQNYLNVNMTKNLFLGL